VTLQRGIDLIMASLSTELNSAVLWNLLGKAVTIAMLPWMVWVSVTVVSMQSDLAVMRVYTADLPSEVRMLRDRIIRLETRIERAGD
jgi:hypothetical protein